MSVEAIAKPDAAAQWRILRREAASSFSTVILSNLACALNHTCFVIYNTDISPFFVYIYY